MKRMTICLCFLLGVFFCAIAQDQAAQKAWMDYMTPGSVHQMIAKADGEWTSEMTMWMDANSQPTKSTGTMVNKMILGGRYQESRFTGNFMGMPFEGIGTLAYDNAKKMFQSTWIDNMGTGIMTLEGKWEDKTKSINLTGQAIDGMTGKEMKVREVFKLIDDNTQLMETYMVQNGKEFKSMEIKFTRK